MRNGTRTRGKENAHSLAADGPQACHHVGRSAQPPAKLRPRMIEFLVLLLAVVLLATKGLSNPVAVALLSVAGLAGILLAFVLEGKTRAALAALADVPEAS